MSKYSEDDNSVSGGFFNENKTKINIKDKLFITNAMEIEKKMLRGFKVPEVKEIGIVVKGAPKSIKSAGQLYNATMKLLSKVNPIAMDLEKKRNEFDIKVMEKKRKDKQVGQKNLGF